MIRPAPESRARAGAAVPVLALLLLSAAGCGERPAPQPRADAELAAGRPPAAPPPADSAPPEDSSAVSVTVVEFREAGGPGVVAVLTAPDSTDAAELDQRAQLVASVGPLVFVERFQYSFACGAHGNTTAGFLPLDLARGTVAPLLDPVDVEDVIEAHRAAAVAAFHAESVATGAAPFDTDSLKLTEFRPLLGGARMRVDWQFTAEACYACGDDRWSSYTRSVRVTADQLPTGLDTIAVIPEEVQAYFRGHPPDDGGGWSRLILPEPRRDALARLFGVTAPAGGPEFLVWRRTGTEVATAWLRGRGRDATPVATAEGVWIVAGERAWRWTETTRRVRTTRCDQFRDTE